MRMLDRGARIEKGAPLNQPEINNPGSSTRGAGDGTRTRDPQLGRLMLYQLSYSRSGPPPRAAGAVVGVEGIEPSQSETPDLQSGPALQLRRTPNQQFKLASGVVELVKGLEPPTC